MSFRLRSFLLALGVVATVLAGTLFLGWQRILAFEGARLDQRLCQEARRLALEPQQAEEAARLQVDLLGKLHLAHPEDVRYRLNTLPGNTNDTPDGQPPAPAGGPGGNAAECLFATHGELPAALGRPAQHATAFGPWRSATYRTGAMESEVAVNLPASQAELHALLQEALWLLVPLSLLMAAVSAALLTAFAMRPLARLRRAMAQVNNLALDQRLSVVGEDREFRELIDAYNAMLARLERSFLQASRFSADAAHELKTPLTILLGRLEQARHALESGVPTSLGEDLDLMQEEVARLGAITRKLLLLAQADAGHLPLQKTRLDLGALLQPLLEDADLLLAGRRWEQQLAPGLFLEGDATLLRQLLNNLLGNALRYCPADGWLHFSAQQQTAPGGASQLVIRLANSSQELEPEVRAHLFERFYRSPSTRTARIAGSGLGLSIAREIARAHGGDLVLEDSAPTVVSFCLTLPGAPPQA